PFGFAFRRIEDVVPVAARESFPRAVEQRSDALVVSALLDELHLLGHRPDDLTELAAKRIAAIRGKQDLNTEERVVHQSPPPPPPPPRPHDPPEPPPP